MTLNDITVDKAYNWLNKFNEDNKSYLGNPVERLINQMLQAVSKGEFAKANYLINIALNVSESTGGSLEQAEAHCRCGFAYYQMGNDIKAITEYRYAISYFDIVHPHNQAITNWLVGYALWRTMKFSNAIVVWEKSCKKFQLLEAVASENSERNQAKWYGEIGAIMCDDLGEAIKKSDQWPYL